MSKVEAALSVARWYRDGWRPGGPEEGPRIYWWKPDMTGPCPAITRAESVILGLLGEEVEP